MTRRIVLLSDGTGNSSASFWRTNVWRMFSALDLFNDDQVACYDDGVGTSSFKPLAILGGAFGVGLKRNVISLYKFACRNFRDEGDQIYGFGFSRGAFTIRVVIGLIIDQGLIPAAGMSESELDQLAHQAYRAYHRHHYHTNWGLMVKQVMRWFGSETAQPTAPPDGRKVPVIRFLGLWDTVAAYGLPVEEMTRGVSQWLWPLGLPSHTLHPSVQRACHALSLDDERTTFHPVLWDESKEAEPANTPRYTSGERLSQVWFAGVHANVGGGYPDDSLAQIPLYWIAQEAKACGLIFKEANPAAIAEIKEAQDKDGRVYDSRSGLGAYYRYGPRRISRLCSELFSRTLEDQVSIKKPKIHASVLKRIKNNAHVYGPIGIPHNYELVVTVPRANSFDADFRIDPLPEQLDGSPDCYELKKDAAARVLAERDAIWPRVYLRAGLYFLTLLVTAFFVVFPLTGRSNVIEQDQNRLHPISELIETAGGFLPDWASPWFTAYVQYPAVFIVLVLLLGFLLWASSRVAAGITDRMSVLWRASLSHANPAPAEPPSNELGFGEWIAFGLRSSWRDYVGPALSALVIVYAVVTIGSHWVFTAVDEAGLVCASTNTKNMPEIPEQGMVFAFDIKEPCFATQYKVGRLDRHLIWTMPNPAELAELKADHLKKNPNTPIETVPEQNCSSSYDGQLKNGGVSADGRGYDTFRNEQGPQLTFRQMLWNAFLLPLKRHYGQPWFQPVARYGFIGAELDFLEADPNPKIEKISENVSPKVPGQLFFYFNDAVFPGLVSSSWFYGDNAGCAMFFVRPSK
ncbi:DUF2235 domain-containing protein [Bradyrhizobium genosp. A]|uniref:DUF2235 domain-containing protein n=1 Tax=Bradyrhizobium genosp. A TaxID=83626 RepID=UPI003CF37D7D